MIIVGLQVETNLGNTNCNGSSVLVDVCVLSREQLGGNKYLLTDGLFVAKILDRTLVEFPAKDARCLNVECPFIVVLGQSYLYLPAYCMS